MNWLKTQWQYPARRMFILAVAVFTALLLIVLVVAIVSLASRIGSTTVATWLMLLLVVVAIALAIAIFRGKLKWEKALAALVPLACIGFLIWFGKHLVDGWEADKLRDYHVAAAKLEARDAYCEKNRFDASCLPPAQEWEETITPSKMAAVSIPSGFKLEATFDTNLVSSYTARRLTLVTRFFKTKPGVDSASIILQRYCVMNCRS